MIDTDAFRAKIHARLEDLGVRMGAIETELDQPKTADLVDQAIDLEDDEVLEALGLAAQKEVRELNAALTRIADGTFGTCAVCGGPISVARLELLPQTRQCRTCAATAANR
ncbi:MAG: TraR/DksA C4-type zinc finger protein [Pseudomonadota bacterium]